MNAEGYAHGQDDAHSSRHYTGGGHGWPGTGGHGAHRLLCSPLQDRVIGFWEVTKTRLAAAEAAIRRQSLQQEQEQREHSVSVKVRWCRPLSPPPWTEQRHTTMWGAIHPLIDAMQVHRDRLKGLLLEHSDREAALRAEAQAALHQLRAELEVREAAAESARRSALHESRLREAAAEEAAAQCRAECERQMAAQRDECERRIYEVQERYERLLAACTASVEAECGTAVRAAEAQRDALVQALSRQQVSALEEAREHYRATAQSQLDLVAALKEDVVGARRREAAAAAEARALRKRLAAPQTPEGQA